MEKNISPVFKDFDKKNLSKREIYKATNRSNQQWYLGKTTKDPVIELVTSLGDYKVRSTSAHPKKRQNCSNKDDLIDGPDKKVEEMNIFDSKSRQKRVNKSCNSLAHPAKSNLLNQWNIKSENYRKTFLHGYQPTSMELTKQLSMEKVESNEIAHPYARLSARFPNYLEDFKVHRHQEKLNRALRKK